jgi:unsaturated rhamnogalacturonyl hydrolase
MSSPSEMSRPSRRSVLLGAAGVAGALTLSAGPAAAATSPVRPDAAAPSDWSKAVVDSTIERCTPSTLGGWGYTEGLYLYAQYLVYKRLGTSAYFDYIKQWVDRFVSSDGTIGNSFTSLDSMRSCQLLPLLYGETGDTRYKKAATQLRNRFPSYPRTSDGGMFHATSRVGQLWGDGVYMAQPFLALYGRTFDDPDYCFEESARNVAVYFGHLQASNGLIYHAYDEDGSESWSSGTGHHSKYHWARAIGWFGMTAIDLLETLPEDHPRRPGLIGVVRHLARGFATYQDARTGRWFQVVDRGSDSRNWLETSASAMYTFMLSRGVQRGYLDAGYEAVAQRGYAGVLEKISLGSDGLTNITDICEGTNVGDLTYYYGRARKTNDQHGLGAFLLMNEQLAHGAAHAV